MKNKIPPKYIRVGITEMRYIPNKDMYFRDAGFWYLKYKWINGKLIADRISNFKGTSHITGMRMVRISEKQWREGNKGYI